MKKISILIAFFLLTILPLAAQEIDCDVKINVEQLTAEGRENLDDFVQQVRQYINGHKWTTVDFGNLKIKCSMEISFLGVNESKRYTAQAFIGSQRPIHKSNRNTATVRILDDKWEFEYVRSQSMIHDEFRFDPLLSFIDYYIYVILGYDFDSYKYDDGKPYFEKAVDLVNKARGGVGAGKGWESTSQNIYSRGQFIDEILNPNYRDIRKAFYTYHYNGLDLLESKHQKAQSNILSALESIGKLREKINQQTLLMRLFFDTKYQEIAETFMDYPDRSVYEKFAKIDQSHQKTYEEYALKPR
ncbi:MAG: DUF4835 family protein [Ignavibacteriales bacterium]|nr:DUF4835 family protein [Ignavibacteriales bacterium]